MSHAKLLVWCLVHVKYPVKYTHTMESLCDLVSVCPQCILCYIIVLWYCVLIILCISFTFNEVQFTFFCMKCTVRTMRLQILWVLQRKITDSKVRYHCHFTITIASKIFDLDPRYPWLLFSTILFSCSISIVAKCIITITYSQNNTILMVSWILKSSHQYTVYRFLETSVPLAKSYFKYNNEIIWWFREQ